MSHWSTDPGTKPEAPWDEWDGYGGCWVCNRCGAGAGFGVHGSTCYYLLDADQRRFADALHAYAACNVDMGRALERGDNNSVQKHFGDSMPHFIVLRDLIRNRGKQP